jgi:hypothetical protein
MFLVFYVGVVYFCYLLGYNTQNEDKQNKIHNTSIENPRGNQEWAAVNIGYNTQHDDKQNKIHNTNIENQKHK